MNPNDNIIYFLIFGTLQEYPRLEILRKRPRESTDLKQYIVLEPKNII